MARPNDAPKMIASSDGGSTDALNAQCQYLESLGFVIAHAYGNRIRVCTDHCFRNEVEVKADSKNILLDICMAFHRKGIVEGQNQFRTNLLSMLNDEVY